MNAHENKMLLEEKGIVMVNVIGASAVGKTTLLEKALSFLTDKYSIAMISSNKGDVERLARAGVDVVQVNKDQGPLDAAMVARALKELPLDVLDLIFIENDEYTSPNNNDLGEQFKIVVASVEEGMDKPRQYAGFRDAFAAVITKIDLLPNENFDLGSYINQLLEVNDKLKIFPLSAQKEEGIEEWSQLIGRMLWKGRRNINVI